MLIQKSGRAQFPEKICGVFDFKIHRKRSQNSERLGPESIDNHL